MPGCRAAGLLPVDSDDIIAFFAAWNVSDLSADIDRSGSTDGDDVVAFFGFWDTGC